MLIGVTDEHLENVLSKIVVTLSGITIHVMFEFGFISN